MDDSPFLVTVQPGISVWRCTEAIDPRRGHTYRTIGSPEGRCIEIITGQNTMLFDRRLARAVAEAILLICGPAEDQEADLPDQVEVVYANDGNTVVGFKPYTPRSGSTQQDIDVWVREMRTASGLGNERGTG